MNTVRPTHLEALHQRADRDGWWVEVQADPPHQNRPGTLTRLQVRHKQNPDRVLFVRLPGRHIQVAAAALLKAMDAQ